MRYFTSDEVQDLVFDNEVETIYGPNRRWTRTNQTIIKADDGKHYKLEWEEGLTENQEHEFYDQEAPEVEKIEKTVVIKEWKEKDS